MLCGKVGDWRRPQGVVCQEIPGEKRAQGVDDRELRGEDVGKAMIVSRDWMRIATGGGRIGGPAAGDRAARHRRRRETLGAPDPGHDPFGCVGLDGRRRRSSDRRVADEPSRPESPAGRR